MINTDSKPVPTLAKLDTIVALLSPDEIAAKNPSFAKALATMDRSVICHNRRSTINAFFQELDIATAPPTA